MQRGVAQLRPGPRRARRPSRRRGRCPARARRRAPTSARGRRAARRRPAGPRPWPRTLHFSGSTTSARAVGRGAAHEAVGRLEVAGLVRRSPSAGRRRHAVWRLVSPSPARLTDRVNRGEHSQHARRAALPGRWASAAPPGSPAPGADAAPLGRRPLKRWRYVGRLRARADALRRRGARSAGLPQSFWAVWDREARRLRERTRPRAAAASRCPTALCASRDRERRASTWRSSPTASRSRCAQPPRRARTSGRASSPVRARGHVHARRAARSRSTRAACRRLRRLPRARHRLVAGAPASASRPTARRSRGTSWPASTTRRAAASARCGSTACRARSGRSRSPTTSTPSGDDCASPPRPSACAATTCWLIASDYRQPFGTFAGTLPGGTELASGDGVMERHGARW